jgi:ribosomal protein L11
MVLEEDRIRKIAELRETLEERVKSIEVELQGLQALLDFINELLIEKSFKKAEEIAKPPPMPEVKPQPVPLKKRVRTIPLKTASGDLLANLYVEDYQIRIVPESNMTFNVNTPPFTAFLIDKILGKMQERDRELVNQGKLVPDKAFSYEIRKAGNVLKEIVIRNLAPQKERELRSSTQWTLEKMYEKAQGKA